MKSNELLVVVGPVGSGKTSLLYTLMNETKIIEGE